MLLIERPMVRFMMVMHISKMNRAYRKRTLEGRIKY